MVAGDGLPGMAHTPFLTAAGPLDCFPSPEQRFRKSRLEGVPADTSGYAAALLDCEADSAFELFGPSLLGAAQRGPPGLLAAPLLARSGAKQPRWRQWLASAKSSLATKAAALSESAPAAGLRHKLAKTPAVAQAAASPLQQAPRSPFASSSSSAAAGCAPSSSAPAAAQLALRGRASPPVREACSSIGGNDALDEAARLRAARSVPDRCRAWLAQQQARWDARRRRLRYGRPSGGGSCGEEVERLRLGACSDSGESAASADACVRVVIGDPCSPRPAARKAAPAAAAAPPPPPAAPLEPVTLHDVWRSAGSARVQRAPSLRSLRTLSVGASDAFFDALSRWGSSVEPTSPRASEDLDALLADLASPHGLPHAHAPAPIAPASLPQSASEGPHVPDPPLLMPDRAGFVFVPIPEVTGFHGYWLKDPEGCTPCPQPIDLMLGSSKLAIKAHETIPGIWLQDTPTTLSMTAKPRSIPLGPLSRYVETFNKDGSQMHWSMRRDVRVGRSTGQMYFTACGTLIFRVVTRGVFSSDPEYVCEEYSRLEDGGRRIRSLQRCKHLASGAEAEQWLVGTRVGDEPPPGHA